MCKNTTYKITDQQGNAFKVEGPPIGVYIKEHSHLELSLFEKLLLTFVRKYNDKIQRYFSQYFNGKESVTLTKKQIYDLISSMDKIIATSEILTEEYLIQIIKASEFYEKKYHSLLYEHYQLTQNFQVLKESFLEASESEKQLLSTFISHLSKSRSHDCN
jgi:hypothetical protein